MAGRTVLVTGGTGGIGRATAEGLAAMGAHVAITGRDAARAEEAARQIRAATGAQVDFFVADLSSQSEVRRLAAEALDRLPRIDVLVNNVGGYWNTRQLTPDGLEHTFAVNHLAPFLLTNLLLDRLKQGASAAGGDGLVPRARPGHDRLRRPPGRTALLRRPRLQPVQARQRPVHLRAGAQAAGQRRHRQRTASRRGEHRVRSRGPRPHPAAGGSAPAAVHEATRSAVPPPRSTWRRLRSSRASRAATSPTVGPSAPPRAAATRKSQLGCGR